MLEGTVPKKIGLGPEGPSGSMAKLLKSSILWTKKCTSETANHCVF